MRSCGLARDGLSDGFCSDGIHLTTRLLPVMSDKAATSLQVKLRLACEPRPLHKPKVNDRLSLRSTIRLPRLLLLRKACRKPNTKAFPSPLNIG